MLKKLLLATSLIFFGHLLHAQCLEVLDGNGIFSDTPEFVSCTPGTYTVFVQPDRNVGNYTIVWGDGTPNSTGASILVGNNVSHTYAGATANYTITITDNSTACTITGLVVLERNPLASIQLPAGDDNFGCTPIQFRFINSSTQVSSNTVFTWDFGDGSPIQTFNASNLGDTVLHTYLPGVGVQSCELNVTLTATNFCGSSNASFFPLRVWDLDEARINPSATLLCYPDTVVQYTNTTIRNCFPEGNQSQRFERWNFGDYWGLGRDSIIEWRPWNPPIMNPPPIAYPGVGTYTVTLQDSSFCGIDDVTLAIQITAGPTAIITSNKDTICEGENVTFINGSFGGANRYRWDYDLGAGFQNQNGNNKTRTYNDAGDYNIQLIVNINGAQGCADTSSVDLHVLPSPNADFTFDANNECDSMEVNFTNTSTGIISTYNWDFGNGNTFVGQSPPTEFYTNPGTYSVTLTVANARGCTDSETKQIRVRETPVANFSVNSVCLNTPATFTDLSTSGGDPISSYSWSFGDGGTSTQQNPTHLYIAFGTYTVQQIVSNGFCSDTAQIQVTVENKPTASFATSPESGCSRLTVNFTNQSSANATSFLWNFGDGSSPVFARDTFHTYANSGDFDTSFVVQMIAYTAFGCSDTTRDTVTVFPIPTPSFTSDAVVDCGPVTVNFTNTTVGDSLNYFWNFGDGSGVLNDVSPTHIFENKTLFINNYQVRLVVASQNGCRDTTIRTVQIYPEPIFTFTSVPDSGCSPLNVTFPSVVGAVNYQWDFGDGTGATGPTPMHTFINNTTNNQNFTVRLIAQSSFGCMDTTFGNVLVFPNPTSNFTIDTNVGCQPLPITFTNNSTGSNNFYWDFGDGTSSTNGNANFVKTFTNTSSSTIFNDIRLITETVSGCKDTLQQTVEVHPFIQAAFTSIDTGCSPLNVSFTNQSIGAQSYMWQFGDGGTSPATSPNHTYTNTTNTNQSRVAELIAISAQGCLDTATRPILIYPKPVANFTTDVTSGCHPLEVDFTQSSSLADFCSLNYGDQDTFKLCGPTSTHTYTNTGSFFPVTYNSQLTVTTVNGCTSTQTIPITVNPQVIANFSSIDSGCSPLNLNFFNQSVGAQNFQWEFGDAANSFSQSPSHRYINSTTSNQTYNLQMVAYSQYNCTDTIQKQIQVFGKPDASIVPSTTNGCHPLIVNFSNQSVGQDSCNWNFGDGLGLVDSCGVNVTHTFENILSSAPVSRQTFLYVYTDEGCSDTTNQIITINPKVDSEFSAPTEGCSPLVVDFSNQSSGASIYNWSFGDGGSSIALNPRHTFIYNGQSDTNFIVNLRASNTFGCFDDSQIVITVNPKPVADYTISSNESCQPVDIIFTNNSTLRDSCSWIFGDGNFLTNNCSPNVVHTYTNIQSLVPLNYLSELRVFSNKGCADTLTRNILVKPQVVANFSGDTIGCAPFNTTFRSQSFGAVSYRWDFGDGRTATGTVVNHTFTNTGSIDSLYTVTLTASSFFNCDDVFTKVVRVQPTPLVGFTATPLTQEFPDTTVFVTNTTNNGNWSYVWEFGDGTSSNLQNPGSHNYATWGNYTIQLKASSANCSDSVDIPILIEAPTPVADFGDSAVGCEPLQVTFNNKTLYGQTYEWDFGDGGSSNSENPTHTYFNEGEYTVTLKVVGFPPGKTDQITKVNYIKVNKQPSADFITSTSKVFIPNDPVVFSNRSQNADSFRWEFGDGNSSTEESPTYMYTEEGEFRVLLIAFTNEGCVDSTFAPTDVIAELEGRVQVPNAFTPNPNGSNGGVVNINPGAGNFNDVFYAKVNGTTEYELNIFNKWGELIFVSKDINIGWDGYYRDRIAPQDVYVWKVIVQFADGTRQVKVGDLMLLR